MKPFASHLIVGSIHRNQDLCVNSDHREILYTIEKCFNMSNVDEEGKYIRIAFYQEKKLPWQQQVSKLLSQRPAKLCNQGRQQNHAASSQRIEKE